MNIIAVDDEPLVLKDLESILKESVPGCNLACFLNPEMALTYAKSNPVDVAFLDIELGRMSGITLAKNIKNMYRDVGIIFVTSYAEYAVEAFGIHATGYLLKPVMHEDIRRELSFVYKKPNGGRKVQIQTFGGFEVFVDGIPVLFKRAKSKELLACLVDRRGSALTTREACSLLWEDAAYNISKKNYLQMIISDLRATLRDAQIPYILIKEWNRLAIMPDSFDCDYYRFLDGDPQAINSYRHNYLSSYSWAEFTMGTLEERCLSENEDGKEVSLCAKPTWF